MKLNPPSLVPERIYAFCCERLNVKSPRTIEARGDDYNGQWTYSNNRTNQVSENDNKRSRQKPSQPK